MQIAAQILDGRIPGGTRMPSIRRLARALAVSVITTKRAYAELEQGGYLEAVPGKGYFVTERSREELRKKRQDELLAKLHRMIAACRENRLPLEAIIRQIRKWYREE